MRKEKPKNLKLLEIMAKIVQTNRIFLSCDEKDGVIEALGTLHLGKPLSNHSSEAEGKKQGCHS